MAASDVQCPNCSSLNRPGARFCSQCRAPLGETSPTAGRSSAEPSGGSAGSFEVPPAPDRSAGRSFKGLIIGLVVLVAAVAAVGYWYFGLQGETLEGLPLVGAAPTVAVPQVPTLFSAPATMISSGPVATLASGVPSKLATRVSGVLQPLTLAPAATITQATASGAQATSVPAPDAVVIVESANLRAGPATLFNVLGVMHQGDPLQVMGRNRIGDWLHVKTHDGKTGWVATSLVRLNISLDTIQVDKAIPTPPPGQPAAPAPVTMPSAQGCPPHPALASISNAGDTQLIIMLQGAQTSIVNVAPRQTANVCLAAGPYQFIATTTSGSTEQGAKVLAPDTPTCWSLPSAAGAAPCTPPSDPGAYSPPAMGEFPMPPGFK